VGTPSGGFLYGRGSDVAGFVEGIHDQHGSPAGLLIDEAKSIRDEILDTLERCHTTFRLFMSSTGQAAGGFYRIMTTKSLLWKTFRVPSSDRPDVSKAEIEADRENLKDSVFRIKRRAVIIPNDEKLVAQLTSRRKQYDSKGREKLDQRPTFEPAVSSRQTAPMPSSAQSSSARNHKSTGKPPSPFKKKSNIACTSIICAQAGGRPHIDW